MKNMGLKCLSLSIPLIISAVACATTATPVYNQIKCDSIAPKIKESKQLLVVISDNWRTPDAKVLRYQRSWTGQWKQVGQEIEGRVGKNGMGWGRGLQYVYGEDSVEFRRFNFRWEGDNKSPAGIFELGETFGTHADVEATESTKPGLMYIPVKKGLQCSDDFHSRFYNRFVVQSDYEGSMAIGGLPIATGDQIVDGEDMFKAADPNDAKYGQWLPYQLGVVVNQNMPSKHDPEFKLGELRHDNYTLNGMSAEDWAKPETQAKLQSTEPAPYGSCIFLHVINPTGEGTSGCTSMPYDDLKDVVKWRSAKKKLLLIQLPIDQWSDIVNRCGDLPKS